MPTDGTQEDPATFAITLDNKGLYLDDPQLPLPKFPRPHVGLEPQNVPDKRNDDIAILQAQLT